MVPELFGKYVKITMVMVLGNHDCIQPDCGTLWLTHTPDFFPLNSLDTTFIYDEIRIDILFAAVGDALVKKFSPVLILSGHSHINLQDRLEDTAAVVVSSFSETPFDCKIVEIIDEKITMKTVSLVDTVDFKAEIDKENLFVMRDASVRSFPDR